MERYTFIPEECDAGKRLDAYLAEQSEFVSRSAVQSLIEKGRVQKNGVACKKRDAVAAGDLLTVEVEEPRPAEILPEAIPLEIAYEDDDLLVVNKPKGMCVHPAPGNETGTLVNALLAHCGSSLSGINGVVRPGIVHRIDKDTSGLLIVAKTDRAHVELARQISVHSFFRQYEAVVYGSFAEPTGSIVMPIGRSEKDRKKMAVRADGRYARTDYNTLGVYSDRGMTYSHMVFTLYTGRTHQIRVHCAAKGHPVAGDDVYGSAERDQKCFPTLEGQCLHARRIGFVHPITGETLSFCADYPPYFETVLTKLRKWGKIE